MTGQRVVPVGMSEAVLLVGMLGSALAALFGTDLGLVAHAQEVASVGFVLAPVVLAAIRTVQHRTTVNAAAVVQSAEVAADLLQQDPIPAAPLPPVPPALSVTPAISDL